MLASNTCPETFVTTKFLHAETECTVSNFSTKTRNFRISYRLNVVKKDEIHSHSLLLSKTYFEIQYVCSRMQKFLQIIAAYLVITIFCGGLK